MSAKDHINTQQLRQNCLPKNKQAKKSMGIQSQQKLPDKIDTKKVVEMIRNADLYELINFSLRANEMENDQVEQFIQKALERSSS